MHYALIFVLLLAFVLGLGLLARRLVIPYPILFVIGGLIIGFVLSFFPHLPQLKLDPDFIFFMFLPPLLYHQAFNTSVRDFRRQLRPIVLMATALVLATTVTVAYVSYWLIPGFTLAAGFVLGAIISPPDAVAASAIAQRLGLPRQVVTILEGESLINDSTSLVLFNVALGAVALNGAPVIGKVWLPGTFLYVSFGGIAVGLAIGWLVGWLRKWVIDDGAQIVLTVSILTPFVSYLAADPLGVSGVLAVVTTGLYLGWGSPVVMTPHIRLEAKAVWEMVIYLLNGMIFVLIGLQLPGILSGMSESWWRWPLFYAAVINFVCIALRLAWVFPGAYVPRMLFRHIRKTEPCPDWREVTIVGWSGMRGVVSLAAALALNGVPNFPDSHLVQFLAFSVIFTTLVFQGLTLPFLIRYLGVDDDGSDAREELEARQNMAQTVMEKIQEIRQDDKFPVRAVDRMEQFYREQAFNLKDDLADQLGWSESRHYMLSVRRLHHLLVSAQRRTIVDMRGEGKIGDDVMHKIERELDLEDVQLKF